MAVALAMAAVTVATPRPCRDCPQSRCEFKPSRVRSWIFAYREAIKHGDDPAEYIRDSIRPSRDEPEVIDPAIRGTSRTNPWWHVEAKLSLERARDVGGIALQHWNADRVSAFLCVRATED